MSAETGQLFGDLAIVARAVVAGARRTSMRTTGEELVTHLRTRDTLTVRTDGRLATLQTMLGLTARTRRHIAR